MLSDHGAHMAFRPLHIILCHCYVVLRQVRVYSPPVLCAGGQPCSPQVFLLPNCMLLGGALCVYGPLVQWGGVQVCGYLSTSTQHGTVESNSVFSSHTALPDFDLI